MVYCPLCSAEIRSGSKFCWRCNEKLEYGHPQMIGEISIYESHPKRRWFRDNVTTRGEKIVIKYSALDYKTFVERRGSLMEIDPRGLSMKTKDLILESIYYDRSFKD